MNHVALAARDVDVTVRFYAEVFGLQPSELAVPGEERNVLMFFPNGSFLHVIDGSAAPEARRSERAVAGNLLYEGDAIDHVALFATDADALEEIRARLVACGASAGDIVDTGGVASTVRFQDPDGRKLEVTAYKSA